MDPASLAAGSVGIPPLNLDQGPSMAMGESDGTNSITPNTGDFTFKGKGRGGAGLSFENIAPLLAIAALGGAAWLIVSRLK